MQVIINSIGSLIPEGSSPLNSQGHVALNLLTALGYKPENAPMADLLRSLAHLNGDWVVLSPILWEASHNDAMIVGTESSDEDAKCCFDLLADYIAEDGLTLYYHSPYLWLMSIDGKPYPNAKTVAQLIHRSLMPELAQLDSSMYWQKFFTECQMVFAAHSKQSAFNGVWAWGAGRLEKKKNGFVCADEASYAMAKECSERVALYTPDVHLKHYDVLLLNTMDSLSMAHQNEIKTSSATWYWNNIAYACNKPNWFIRMWRHLIHDH